MEMIKMYGKNNKISNLQVAFLMGHTIIGVGILSLPSTLAEVLGTSGWVAVVIAGAIAIIPVTMISKLMAMYEGKNIFEISSHIIGRPLTYVALTLVIIDALGQGAFVTRIFGEVIKMFLLFSTPLEVILLTMLLTVVYTVRSEVEGVARFSMIVIPFIVIPILIMSTVLIPDLDFTNLLPIFKVNPVQIFNSIPSIFFSFGGIELLLIYMYYSKNPKSALKYNIGVVIAVTVLYLFSFFISLARFGEKGLAAQLWPLLSLSKAIQFPSAFIENVEGIIMAIWVIIAFTTLMSTMFSMTVLLGKMCKVEESKYFTLPLLPLIYFLSLIPGNVVLIYDFIQVFTYIFGTFALLLYPTVLYTLAVLKRKGEAKKNENTV
ncbi:MAG: endospore germination permease [Tissierellales bacterium]